MATQAKAILKYIRDGLVWKYAYPYPTAALDVACERAPRRLDLPRRNPSAGGGLETILTKADPISTRGDAAVAAFVLLTVFRFFRL